MSIPVAKPVGQGGISSEQVVEASPPPPELSADRLEQRWLRWPATALERLPWPYLITVILLGLAALGEQLLERSLEASFKVYPGIISPLRLAVFPALVFYILLSFFLLKRISVRALAELRPAVNIGDQDYEEHARRMIMADLRTELVLLLVSITITLIFFVVLKLDLLNTNSGLPADLPQAVFIVIMYILLGWLLLAVVYSSLRYARALNALANCPLIINNFDLGNLLPFGRLGLIQSLPIVGIVLVPLILLGTPTKGGYLVIFLSVISSLALFIPLWGVHRQIDQCHESNLSLINQKLQDIKTVVLEGNFSDPSEVGTLADRTDTLLALRKTILETPTWPFKDSATVIRASLTVASPLIYFILNELIRAYIFPFLSGGSAP